jgi:hypothetical protein
MPPPISDPLSERPTPVSREIAMTGLNRRAIQQDSTKAYYQHERIIKCPERRDSPDYGPLFSVASLFNRVAFEPLIQRACVQLVQMVVEIVEVKRGAFAIHARSWWLDVHTQLAKPLFE